jgi:DNA-directed RNA polymerase subunit beta
MQKYNKISTSLKTKLVDKLTVLLNGKTSQGVYNNFKGSLVPKKTKFTHKMLMGLDYNNINPKMDNR